MAKRYIQIEVFNYFNNFSSVAKMTTVQVLLELALTGSHLHQTNVNNSFSSWWAPWRCLHDSPTRFSLFRSNKVCKLVKFIYGLKHVSHQWFKKLSHVLVECGYTQAFSYHNLFTKADSSTFIAFLIYVNDIILASNCLDEF